MITGFNTDIEHGGVTYHVQTEDKGVETPLILSLVYNRGTILASKRTPYDDLVATGFNEKVLAERLQKQHKLICAAVRAGRIEELKSMTAKDAAQKREAKSAARAAANALVETPPPPPAPAAVEIPPADVPRAFVEVPPVSTHGAMPSADLLRATNLSQLPPIGKPSDAPPPVEARTAAAPDTRPVSNPQPAPPAPAAEHREARPTQPLARPQSNTTVPSYRPTIAPPVAAPAAIPQPKEPFVPAIPQPNEELVWDLPLQIIDEAALAAVEHETIIAADAVEIITDVDVVSRPVADNLEIEFMNETSFRAGERKTLNIRVFRGRADNCIPEAQVMVKVLGSSFRPLIFHARTNYQGVATVHLQLPQFRSGRGAILVRAISDGEEAELRQIVKQN